MYKSTLRLEALTVVSDLIDPIALILMLDMLWLTRLNKYSLFQVLESKIFT